MNAQISFLDGTYALIHIPLNVYSSLLQPILRTLLPQTQDLGQSRQTVEHELEGLNRDNQHVFFNISITPIECSVVCHTAWAKNVFEPYIATLPRDVAKSVSISSNEYTILAIISAGLDAADRVMELSSPLALAGIPIFFITTYYSDFILVPVKEKKNVTQALHDRGLELSENQSDFVNSAAQDQRRGSTANGTPPRTPPPSNVDELQKRTFELLKKRNVKPFIEQGLELVQCSGQEISQLSDMVFSHRQAMGRRPSGNGHRSTWIDNIDPKLYTCVVSALVSQPRFLSLTLAQGDPPSLLLDKTLLPLFGDSLLGDIENTLIPIMLDLVTLPLEVTGIVCGVAGRLVRDMQMMISSELSYLSTARAGAVILPEEQSRRALSILGPLLEKESQQS